MKRRILALLLCVGLASTLAACQREAPAAATDSSVTELTASEPEPTRSTEPEPTEPETQEPEYVIWREPDSIVMYPFTEDELAEAQRIAEAELEKWAQETGTLTFEVERIAYDPTLTDVSVRQQIADAPVEGWSESDYYAREISFAVTLTATHDHEKSPIPDYEHDMTGIRVCRDDVQSPWYYADSGVPVARYSDCALSREEIAELESLGEVSGTLLAAYHVKDSYMLYVYNEAEKQFYYMDAWIIDGRLRWEGKTPLLPLNTEGT